MTKATDIFPRGMHISTLWWPWKWMTQISFQTTVASSGADGHSQLPPLRIHDSVHSKATLSLGLHLHPHYQLG